MRLLHGVAATVLASGVTAWSAGLCFQEDEKTFYLVQSTGITIASEASGRVIDVPPFAYPSFERSEDGDVLAALQCGDGIRVLRIGAAGESWSEVDWIRGGQQPLVDRGRVFYTLMTRKAERLCAKEIRGRAEVLITAKEIGGFSVASRGPRTVVVAGVTSGGLEHLELVEGRPGEWSHPRTITDRGADRFWPDVAIDENGRIVVASIAVGGGIERVAVLHEADDMRFSESLIAVDREHASSPMLDIGANRLFWISSGLDGRSLTGVNLDSPDAIRLVMQDLGMDYLTRVEAGLYAGAGAHVDLAALDLARCAIHTPQPKSPVPTASQTQPTPSFDRYSGYGDSIMEGDIHHKDVNRQNAAFYPEWRDELVQRFGVAEVYNDGEGGERTDEGSRRIQKVIDRDPPAGIVCIMEGTNDVSGRRGNYTAARTTDNLKTICETVRAIGAIPIISTIIPRSPSDKFDPRNKKTRAWNREIRKMTRENGFTMIGLYKIFVRTRNWQRELMEDDLHPNSNGYKLMGEKWLDAIIENRPTVTP